jgi:putative transposase
MRESVVVRYDPMDVSQVFVFHENEFVCIAGCPELCGRKPTQKEIQKAKTYRKKHLRSTISSAKALVKSHSSDSARPIPPATAAEVAGPATPKRQHQPIRRYSVDE